MHRQRRLARILLIFACTTIVFSCGRSGPKNVAVQGDVTYRGQPVEAANVLFISTKNRPASATTDSQGHFKAVAIVTDEGAKTAEEQVVCCTKSVPNPNYHGDAAIPARINILPKRYATPLRSPLKALVTLQSPNEFHFELTD